MHGDEWLTKALREKRPGAVGYVYNVHGPDLIEHADALLGDHDLAVATVRKALVAAREDPAAVPDPGAFRDWLFDLVRMECEAASPAVSQGPSNASQGVRGGVSVVVRGESPASDKGGDGAERRDPAEAGEKVTPEKGTAGKGAGSGRRGPGLAVGAAGAVVALSLAVVAVVWASGVAGPPEGTVGAPQNSQTVRQVPPVPPPAPSPSSSSPSPAPKESKTPKRSERPENAEAPTTRPDEDDEPSPAQVRRLRIDDSDCQGFGAGALGRCQIRLTARGGTVRWAVSSVDGYRVYASGSGTLSEGESTAVSVTVRPSVRCYATGRGSGTVSFSPGGQAAIVYTCWRP